MSTAAADAAWEELRARVASCQRCELCQTRQNTVFGQGAVDTPLVLVGEGPGRTRTSPAWPSWGGPGSS